MKLSEKKHLALVLSGGGIKAAAFHIGVCLALREKGFKFAGGQTPQSPGHTHAPMTFQTYVGSSAGAFVSTFLAAGYSIDAIIDAFTRGNSDLASLTRPKAEGDGHLKPLNYRDIFSLNLGAGSPKRILPNLFKKKPFISGGLEVFLKRGFKVNGLFSGKNIERYLRNHVYPANDFKTLGAQLYIVATQLNHSRKAVFGPYDTSTKSRDIQYANYATVSQAVAASTALPPFFSPYGIKNEKGRQIYYFDGEIRDTLSTHVAAEHGADLVISSYSIQPYHYNAEFGSLHEYGIPVIANQALYQSVQQKIERHIKNQKDMRAMINAVKGYLTQASIPEEHREKLIEILLNRTGFNPNVDYVYIHPSPNDHEFFFYDHFSLNPKVLSSIVRTGFRSAMTTLRQHNI